MFIIMLLNVYMCFVFFILIAENEDPSQNDIVQGTRRILSTKGRWEIFSALLEKSVDGKLKKKYYKRSFIIYFQYQSGQYKGFDDEQLKPVTMEKSMCHKGELGIVVVKGYHLIWIKLLVYHYTKGQLCGRYLWPWVWNIT